MYKKFQTLRMIHDIS